MNDATTRETKELIDFLNDIDKLLLLEIKKNWDHDNHSNQCELKSPLFRLPIPTILTYGDKDYAARMSQALAPIITEMKEIVRAKIKANLEAS